MQILHSAFAARLTMTDMHAPAATMFAKIYGPVETNREGALNEKSLYCCGQQRNVLVRRGSHNRVGAVELAVGEMVAHTSNLFPRDIRLHGGQSGIQIFHPPRQSR